MNRNFIFGLILLSVQAANVLAADKLELQVIYSDANLSPSNNSTPNEMVVRRTFKVYLKNKSEHPLKVLAGNKTWADQIDGQDIMLSLRISKAPGGQVLAVAESDFRPIMLQPDELCLLHQFNSQTTKFADIATYRFEYAVDDYFAERFHVWAGSVVVKQALSEKEVSKTN